MPLGQFLANALQNAQNGIANQWDNGRPYREAMGAALTGHLADAGQILKDKVATISPQDLNEGIMNTGLGFAPMAMAGVTAFHGSPHLFDKFDMNKIGTGEGAQAYGHGLYFAENQGVARDYQRNLSPPDFTKMSDGTPISIYLQHKLQQSYKDLKWSHGSADPYDAINDVMNGMNKSDPLYKEAVKVWKYPPIIPGGQMYKVDIPDHAIPKMLDWDKPLSEQSPEVQKAVVKGMQEHGWGPNKIADVMQNLEPQRVLNYLSPSGNKSQATETLQKYGITGIRYLDGGSRGTGQGTSNYVLFDDQLPKILERNGQPFDPQIAAQQLQKAVGQ